MDGSHPLEDGSLNVNGGVSQNDPQDTFEKSENLWQRLIQEYPDLLRDNEEMQEIRKQLRNKEIIMCVFGRHNCGKSTLLNALMRNRCLPINMLNETGIHVKIKHDPCVHPGHCTDTCQGRCPRLSDGTTTSFGAKDIWSVLKKANAHHRQTGVKVQQYTLHAHVPIMENVEAGWDLVLVDTPGFGEAEMESVTSLATKLLNTSSAYLYIVDCTNIGDVTDATNMKSLFDRDQRLFQDNRIVIAVTKYDCCCPEDSPDISGTMTMQETAMSQQEVQQHVCDEVRRTTGVKCPLDIIVPISAKWAEKAQQLRQNPLQIQLRHQVTESLRKVPDSPLQGQGETASSSPSVTLASQLERSSGIIQLEERLKGMIEHCKQCWVLGLATGYTHHLGKAKNLLQEQLEMKQEDVQGIQHANEQHEKYQQAKKEFMGKSYKGDEETPIEKHLKKRFEEVDMPEAKRLSSSFISELMRNLATTIENEIMKQDPPFGEESLKAHVEKFVLEELQPKLSEYILGFRLDGVASLFREYQHGTDKEDMSIEAAALAFLPEDWTPENDALRKERERLVWNIQERELLQAKGLKISHLMFEGKPDIPPIKLTRFQRFVDLLKGFFGWKVDARPYQKWNDDLKNMIEKFESMSIREADDYIENELKNWIVEILRDTYHEQMKTRAAAICGTFENAVNTTHAKLKSQEEDITAIVHNMPRYIAEISENLESLGKLRCQGK